MSSLSPLCTKFIDTAKRAAPPFPLLVICGPQGSGKTSLLRDIFAAFEPGQTACLFEVPDYRIPAGWLLGIDNNKPVTRETLDRLLRLRRPILITSLHPVDPKPGIWVVNLRRVTDSPERMGRRSLKPDPVHAMPGGRSS